jgi:hypothetical protein
LLAAFTVFGAFVGLLTGVFTLWDRYARGRPSIFLIAKDYKTQIHINNVTNETIIIDEITIKPDFLRVFRGNDLVTANEERAASLYGNAARELPEGVYLVVKPLGQRTAPLHSLAHFESADGKQAVKIRCRWQNTRQPLPWPRYARVKTTVKVIRDLKETSMAGKA